MLWGAGVRSPEGSTNKKFICDLWRATPGSAGLDLCSTTYTVLTPDMGVQTLPTGIYGPLPPNMVGLLLGRSSITVKGLTVMPGVIDEDYEGKIKIMIYSPTKISVIQTNQRIAQLILLPKIATKNKVKAKERGSRGFGSSDAYWIQAIGPGRPELRFLYRAKNFTGLLDTGADVSVITLAQWPTSWPKHCSITQLQGIGQSQNPEISSNVLPGEIQKITQGLFSLTSYHIYL